ncbi:MAG: hypothetical protein E7C49_15175 [Clostridium sp.]|nr:hypothetical protein [Clostridium sp.]
MNKEYSKHNIYRYTVYGLNIESDIELPELVSIEHKDLGVNNIDINIHYGDLSEAKKKISGYVVASVSRNDMYVSVENIALYRVVNGNEIIVDPEEGAKSDRVRSFLLGRAFGVLFVERGTVAIHGSTIIKDGKGIIIAGHSGAGKSTLSAALKQRGYKFITDDVSALNIDNYEIANIEPAYPLQKICRDTLENLGYKIDNFELSKKTDTRERYVLPSEDSFINDKFPMGAFCEIAIGDNEEVIIEEITGTEKIKSLFRNGYFVNIERNIGLRQDYLTKYIKIAKNIPFYKITRPDGKFTVNEQVELFEKVI